MLIFLVFLAYLSIDGVRSSNCLIFLTVSTREFSYYRSNLVINWGPDCVTPPFSIKLYDYNPYHVQKPMQIFTAYPHGRVSGNVETSIRLNAFTLPYKWDSSTSLNESLNEKSYQKCLDFYIVSYNETNQATNFDCLKIQPQWMTDNSEIWNLKLKDLFIPGTHCSGCYMTRENARQKKEKGFAQNFDIWHQLVLGARFLDFSVGIHKQVSHNFFNFEDKFYENIFWVKNGDFLISPLLEVLKDVAKFAKRSKEIVIINFNQFSDEFSATSELHEVLKHLISEEIGSIAYVNNRDGRNSFDLTIQEMMAAEKYLLILYNSLNSNAMTEHEPTFFWPVWEDLSGMETKTDLVSYMKNVFGRKFRDDNSNGWILSLAVDKINPDDSSKLREKAAAINLKALFPLGGPWSLKSNVVLLDFAFSTNFIDVAVYVNKIKGAAHGNFTVIDMS